MRSLIVITIFISLLVNSCKQSSKKILPPAPPHDFEITQVHDLKKIIHGVWIKKKYLMSLKATRSAYKASSELEGISEMHIDTSEFVGDSLSIGASWNNHEGWGFKINLTPPLTKLSMRTNIPTGDNNSHYEIFYTTDDTLLFLYKVDKAGRVLEDVTYTRIWTTWNNPESFADIGINYVARSILLAGNYHITDTAGKSMVVLFNADGSVKGWEGFSNYDVLTDFVTASVESDILILKNEKHGAPVRSFPMRLFADSIILYNAIDSDKTMYNLRKLSEYNVSTSTKEAPTQIFNGLDFSKNGWELYGIAHQNSPNSLQDSLGNFYTDNEQVLKDMQERWRLEPGSFYSCGYHYTMVLNKANKQIGKYSINLDCGTICFNGCYTFPANLLRNYHGKLKKIPYTSYAVEDPLMAQKLLYNLEAMNGVLVREGRDTLWKKFPGFLNVEVVDSVVNSYIKIDDYVYEKIKVDFPNEEFMIDKGSSSHPVHGPDEYKYHIYCSKNMGNSFKTFKIKEPWMAYSNIPLYIYGLNTSELDSIKSAISTN